MKRFVLLLFLFPSVCFAQSPPESPEIFKTLFNDLKLGVRVGGGGMSWGHTVPAIANEEAEFLGRPVSSDVGFQTFTFGASAALRIKGAEIRYALRTNRGQKPNSRMAWVDGTPSIPLRPGMTEQRLSIQYMAFDHVGIGMSLFGRRTTLNQNYRGRINLVTTNSTLFEGVVDRTALSLFVPVTYPLNDTFTAFGRVEGSVYGRSTQKYNLVFLRHQTLIDQPDSELIRQNLPVRRSQQTSWNRQSVMAGVRVPLGGTSLRLSTTVSRVDVPNASADWHSRVQLELGVPF